MSRRLLKFNGGSVRWGRRFLHQLGNSEIGILNSLETLPVAAGITMLTGHQEAHRFVDGYFHYPALAVPVEAKDTFVCPPEHVRFATRFLRECSNVLIIGFSAVDKDVLGLLKAVPELRRLGFVGKEQEVTD